MTYTTGDGRRVDFRLMDQLKPHVVRVAIALRFPQHAITAVECHDEPVYHLLSEWLRGANRERDPRPVTWRTLIEALRDTNCQEEADKLEQYLIEPTSRETDTSGDYMQLARYYKYNNTPSGAMARIYAQCMRARSIRVRSVYILS